MLSVPRHLRTCVGLPALALAASATILVAPAPAHALDAAAVLRTAQAADNGDARGQCKVFVNTVVASASRGTITLGRYHAGYAEAGAVEVDLTQAGPGDIIQVTPAGSTDATAETLWRRGGPLHSAIVERNLGNGRFAVIDSNWGGDERVTRHEFAPLAWAASKGGGIVKAWRFGKAGAAPALSTLGDGSFIRVAGSSALYRLAGAAPLPVTGWAAVGGEGPVTEVDWATVNNLAPFPVDGTILRAGPAGPLYRVAKGVPRRLADGAAPARPAVVVDPLVIANAGGPGAWSRLRNVAFEAKGLATTTAITAAPRRVARGARVAVTARVRARGTQAPAGRCTLQRRTGTRWADLGSAKVGPTGTCRIRARIGATAMVRVAYIAATGWRSGHSAGRRIAVRA